ncbi:MAG: type VII toxin-antitoxin system MntA family adenylyltransferase antitoxin [Anaerolineae bacterium]
MDNCSPLPAAIAEELRAYLRQEGAVLAYLFGSVARGNAGPLSDVDVGVLFPGVMSSGQAFDANLRLAARVPALLGRPADVVVLNAAPPLLRFVIIDEGIILLNDDDNLRVEFEARTIMEYLDTKHLREIQRQYLYERILGGTFGTAL